MSFSSGFSGNQDNEEFMQALDKVYNAPTFNRKAFQCICLNTAKTSKIGGNDYNCTSNLQKLFLECERLSDIAQQKTTLLNEQKKELEAVEKDRGLVEEGKIAKEDLIKAQKEIKSQKSEVEILKQTLKNKDDQVKLLKDDKSRMVKEHMAAIEKLKNTGKSKAGTFRIDELDKVIFDQFNNDLTSRLDFISKILDWQRFGAIVQGIADAEILNAEVQDGELAAEHFTVRKSRLNLLMDKVYFPTIDAQEHLDMYNATDFSIKLEHEKYHDQILVELVTIQNVLHQLGFDSSVNTPGKGKTDECTVSEHDRMILGGLMKRLLNMIPVRQKGDQFTSNDFNSKMSNLYLLLRQRTSIKNAFEVSLEINTQKAQDDIDTICERILSCILDYDDFCKLKEEEAAHKNEMPKRILNLFQRKIAQKMMAIKKQAEGPGKRYQSSMISK